MHGYYMYARSLKKLHAIHSGSGYYRILVLVAMDSTPIWIARYSRGYAAVPAAACCRFLVVLMAGFTEMKREGAQ